MHAHVLIVEDDHDVAESLVESVELEGYSAKRCRNGIEALDYLAKNDLPCVILIDYLMPGMNGIAFRELQLRDKRAAAVPAILLSGAAPASADKNVRFDGYLSKPIPLADLVEVVGRHCSHAAS